MHIDQGQSRAESNKLRILMSFLWNSTHINELGDVARHILHAVGAEIEMLQFALLRDVVDLGRLVPDSLQRE